MATRRDTTEFKKLIAGYLVQRLEKPPHRVCTYRAAVDLGVSPGTIRAALRYLTDHNVEVAYLGRDRCWHTQPDHDAKWDLHSIRDTAELGGLSPAELQRLRAFWTFQPPRRNPGRVLYVVAFARPPELTEQERQRLKSRLMAC